jgi:hypothetical protein
MSKLNKNISIDSFNKFTKSLVNNKYSCEKHKEVNKEQLKTFDDTNIEHLYKDENDNENDNIEYSCNPQIVESVYNQICSDNNISSCVSSRKLAKMRKKY